MNTPGVQASADLNGAPTTPSRRRGWIILIVVAVLGLWFDLGSKSWAFRTIADAPVIVQRQQVLETSKVDPSGLMVLVPHHEPKGIKSWLEFQLVLNNGAVFGAGQGRRWMFIGFTGVVLLIALYAYARYSNPRSISTPIGVGMVIAGGVGNLYDRIVYACVRDFIHPLAGRLLPWGRTWPNGSPEVWPYVSNVADALLLIGIAILIIKMWKADAKKR